MGRLATARNGLAAQQPAPGETFLKIGEDGLNPGQLEAIRLMRGHQRHTCLVGGARAGKTVLIMRVIITRALKGIDSRHAILRYNRNAVWPSIGMETMPFVMKRFFPGVKFVEHSTYTYFTLPKTGAEIWLGGLGDKKQVEHILGREYSTIFFNECSQIPYNVVDTVLSRLAQVVPRLRQRAYYDLNPGGKGHWTNILFGAKKDPISSNPLPDPENYERLFLNPEQNRANLDEAYMRSLQNMSAKQRMRFYEGKYIDELPNALWSLETIERNRIDPKFVKLPDMRRIVVAVDPSGSGSATDESHDMIGIVAAGLGVDGVCYVLEDATRLDSPIGWAKAAIGLYRKWGADKIVAEVNFGGAMVEATLRAAAPGETIPFKAVTASRGKVVRAEPVAALYGDPYDDDTEKPSKVRHVGHFPDLEAEMTEFTDLGYTGDRSPNRCDALVWCISELALGENIAGWMQHYKNMAAEAEARSAGTTVVKLRARSGQRPVFVASKPHTGYQPHKERRYQADASGVLWQVTPGGMLLGIDPEDIPALEKQGCWLKEDDDL